MTTFLADHDQIEKFNKGLEYMPRMEDSLLHTKFGVNRGVALFTFAMVMVAILGSKVP